MRKIVSNLMRILMSFESVQMFKQKCISRVGPGWTGYISCESVDEDVLLEL